VGARGGKPPWATRQCTVTPSLAKTLTLSVPAGFWVNNLVRFGPRNEPSANYCLDYGAELEG